MVEKVTIARPYARAAFAYAQQANALAEWSEALNAAAAVVSNANVRKLIGNPKVDTTQLLDFIADVLSGKLNTPVRNFIEELQHNRRLGLLPEVATMFDTMRAEVENVADVHVTSAVALDEAQRQRLAGALKKRLRKDVRLHCDVDPGLIGGAVIRSGDWVLDGSLRARLERLSGAMTH